MSIFHLKAPWNCSKLEEAKAFIQLPGMTIGCNNSIKLHKAEMMAFCLPKTVHHQLPPNLLSAFLAGNRITGICNMPAPANIIGMKNIQAQNVIIF